MASMHILSPFCRESSLLNLLANVTDPDHFWKLVPDPRQIKKLDLDPHQSEKQNPDPHQNEKVEALEGHFGAVESLQLGKK
jgi:hypothetical protein